MSTVAILVLSLGLAMDAVAVAAARGAMTRQIKAWHLALVAGYFGGAQGLMPLCGWWLGHRFGHYVAAWDHWIVFAVLGGLGARAIADSRDPQDASALVQQAGLYGAKVMAALAIATSIDAFAVGITLPMLGAPLVKSVLMIGCVTGALSAAGLWVGHRLGVAFGSRINAVGGWMLVLLGAKILVEHLTA